MLNFYIYVMYKFNTNKLHFSMNIKPLLNVSAIIYCHILGAPM